MAEKIEVDGKQYDLADLSEQSKQIVVLLQNKETQINEKTNLMAILTKAKKAYIADMKAEMLSQKAGFDFSD